MRILRAIPALAIAAFVTWGTATAQAQVEVVVGERAMPAPIVEVVPVARPGWSWVPGHWVWRRGAWFWVKGHRGGDGDAGAGCRGCSGATIARPCLGERPSYVGGWTLGVASGSLGSPVTVHAGRIELLEVRHRADQSFIEEFPDLKTERRTAKQNRWTAQSRLCCRIALL